jgi:ATP-binding cassette subfamily F protein uup
MSLVSLKDVSLAYGHLPLLDHTAMQIEPGERVCLVGRNGVGKSSLFRILSRQVSPDDGEVWFQDTLRIAYLEQEVPEGDDASVFDVVASGLGETGELIKRYHVQALRVAEGDADALQAMHDTQQQLEAADGWLVEQRVEEVVSRLALDAEKKMSELSGGYKRRVLLARALVIRPDLLLLDEPTNHLDIASINWLEDYLRNFHGAILFITHDRAFLQNLATRILELDRGKLTSWPGDFQHYLQKKSEQLDAEAVQNAKFDKKLAEEEAWIRKGIKARRTRNEGRVRALQKLREQRQQRRERSGKVAMQLDATDASGKIVAELEDISLAFGDEPILSHFSTRLLRGDRVGIMGPNGSGKSTLLKILLGELKPDSGKVRLGTKLEIAYFDQQRAILDESKSVMDNLNEGSEFVEVRGRKRHVISYLRDFLFPVERVKSPVKTLSGGERNRLLLAKLFTQPANMLVLDEPTNDLDVETLELLEELLLEFDGTLLLVSHDRRFLDNVVTSTIVFEGPGVVREYVGGYEDWQRQGGHFTLEAKQQKSPAKDDVKSQPQKQAPQKRKLTYKEQHELDALPVLIETLEQEQGELQSLTSQADFYQRPSDEIAAKLGRLESIATELASAYERWNELDS